MYILLRRQVLPNPDTLGPAYVEVVIYWDTTARTYYNTQDVTATSDPFELAANTEVQRVTLNNGQDRIFYYAGDGRVQTKRAPGTVTGGTGAVCTLTAPRLTPNPASTADSSGGPDAAIDVLPQLGAPPYQLVVQVPGGAPLTATVRSSTYPVRLYNLSAGTYPYQVTDALGCQQSGSFLVTSGTGKAYGALIKEAYYGSDTTGTGTKIFWNTNSLTVETYQYTGGGTDGYLDQSNAGDVLDGYYLPDGVTWRTVYSDGNVSVYFRDSSTAAPGTLALHNLILFHPDSTVEQNGGVLVEVDATAPPLSFSLAGQPDNATGRFDGLAAGDYTVTVADAAGNTLAVPFSLRVRYGVRWVLDFDDIDGIPLRLELWLRGYTGLSEVIYGQGDAPVVLRSDGLNGALGGQGDVPVTVGTSCELNLLVLPGTLEAVVVNDDRACRCDVYRDGDLQFRGYVTPDVYTEPLLSGYLPISLTATDGLAGLKNTDFEGHIGQRLTGRWPILNTLLHCLSRCDVSLPLALAVNRRATEMSDADAPELLATTERAGYWQDSNGEPTDLRTVVDALNQAVGGTLVQREGQWQLRSPLEALADAPARCYRPAGTPLPGRTVPAPTGVLSQAGDPRTYWLWQDASQQQQVRPGWKSLTGTTDAGWLKDAFPAGAVFSDKYSWLEDGSRLRPVAGWLPGPDGYPLLLVRGGAKSTELATQLPRSSNYYANDTRYLQSPPLPLEAAPEGCPAFLSLTAKLVPVSYLPNGTTTPYPNTAQKATISYEVLLDGQRPAAPSTAVIPLAATLAAAATTITVPLDPVPAGVKSVVLRLYAWTAPNTDLFYTAPLWVPGTVLAEFQVRRYSINGVMRLFMTNGVGAQRAAPTGQPNDPYWYELPANDYALGLLLLSSVGIELRPQNATWDGTDNFRADGPAGTVRPTDVLSVYHPDVPVQAGLFEGNRHAFNKAVALADGSLTTAWARTLDLAPAPLFEANVLDPLALREGPSRLLTGTLRHRVVGPPLLLDSVDTPDDVPGRRFFVGAAAWNMRQATTEVSLVEIGPGADAPDPLLALSGNVRITHQAYQYVAGKYTHHVRGVHGGGVRSVR